MKFDPMIFVLVVIVSVIVISFAMAHMNPANSFNLFDLLLENGRLSKISCLVMGAFTVHTWIMVYLTLHDKMSEGYLTIYGATWVAPLLTKLFTTKEPTP